MADMLKRLMTVEVKEVENRVLEIAGSTEDKDRMGDIIRADGWKLKHFKKNPVFMWVHDYGQPPIGKATKVWVDKATKRLMFKVEFAGPEVYEFADIIYKLYLGGFLHATSVGFIPLDWEGKSEEHPYPPWGEAIYTSQELLELSAVPVPANANALVDARDQGLITVKEFEAITKPVEPLQVTESDGEDGELRPEIIERLKAAKELPKEERINLEEIRAKIAEGTGTVTEKPYPNEHACRLRDPADFDDDSFRRTEREHEGKKYSVISGKLEGEDTMTEQAYRYNKDTWTASEARTHCKDHDGKFEAASKGEPEPEPEPKIVSQAQLGDDIAYLRANIEAVGLNDDNLIEAWALTLTLLRLAGNDIPDNILREVKAVIGEKQATPLLLPTPDPPPDPMDKLKQRAADVAEVANLVVAKLQGKRIPK